MQPVLVNVSDISQWVARLWWPVLRVGGFVVSAPIASEATIPGPVKIALSLGLAFILAPLAPVPAGLSVFSGAGAAGGGPGGAHRHRHRDGDAARLRGADLRGPERLHDHGPRLRDPGRSAARRRDAGARAAVHDIRHAHLSRRQRAPRAHRRPRHELQDPAHRRCARRSKLALVARRLGRAGVRDGTADRAAGRDRAGDRESRARRGHARRAAAQSVRHRIHDYPACRISRADRRPRRPHGRASRVSSTVRWPRPPISWQCGPRAVR